MAKAVSSVTRANQARWSSAAVVLILWHWGLRTREERLYSIVDKQWSVLVKTMAILGEEITKRAVTPTALGSARQDIGLAPFEHLHKIACEKHLLHHGELALYKGYRLFAVDGSTLNLHSTAPLAEAFGRPNSTGRKRALPQASFTTLELVNTAWIWNYRLSGHLAGELAESKAITASLGHGDLLLADRLYFDPAWYVDLQNRRVKFLFRLNKNRYSSLTKASQDRILALRAAGNVDCRVDLKVRRKDGTYAILPNLRYIEIKRPGADTLYFITNLGEEEVTTLEAAELYKKRWEIETDFRIFKGQAHLPVVRSRREDTVRQEVLLRILAHNSVRYIQSEACQLHHRTAHEPQPERRIEQTRDADWKPKCAPQGTHLRPVDLQFYRTAECTLGLILEELLFPGRDEPSVRWEVFLNKIAGFRVMAKPGRSYPRNSKKYNKGKPNKGDVRSQRQKAYQRKKGTGGES